MSAAAARWEEVRRLHRARPRSRMLRASAALLTALFVGAWFLLGVDPADIAGAERLERLSRFIEEDATPRPLREGAGGGSFGDWALGLWNGGGAEAMLSTLGIAVLAIVLAALGGWFLGLFGARTLMSAHPFLPHGSADPRSCSKVLPRTAGAVRVACVLLRGIPEYVWAFLFLAMLGPSAWPAVLALAIHNAGILGRLGGETVENLPPAPLRALSMAGASRRQVAATAVFPLALGRYLLYFFYRFETCVREATVLGMLGVASLGYEVVEARARDRYDEMLFYVGLAAFLVLMADLLSDFARRWLRAGV
jgi:phosphonate transport system permease protein